MNPEESAINRAGPLVIVLSGPSGVGKDAVLNRMKQMELPLFFTVTCTTRARREWEQDGKDYFFISTDKFQKMIGGNEFLEWATVYGHYYGVPKNQVKEAFKLFTQRLHEKEAPAVESVSG